MNKFQTIIEDDCLCRLRYPAGGAGAHRRGDPGPSTIPKDVAENELVITRVPQRHIQNWARPVKKK